MRVVINAIIAFLVSIGADNDSYTLGWDFAGTGFSVGLTAIDSPKIIWGGRRDSA
jgi:hypothetical protein